MAETRVVDTRVELEVIFHKGTVVVRCDSASPNVLDAQYGTFIAAGSPRSVAETLKEIFVETLARLKAEPETAMIRMAEMTEQGD